MENKNWQSVYRQQNQYRLKMLRHSGILKAKLLTLLKMALRKDIRLGFKILMIYFQLTRVNLLRSLAFHPLAKAILSTKWSLDTMEITAGKQLLLHRKMR